jgi:CLIP-associating protein 1/2
VPIDHSDLVADLLKELSNHNERVEERKGALLELLKITREDSLGVWEEHFKTILLLLLETLGDKDVGTSTAPSTWWWCDVFPDQG